MSMFYSIPKDEIRAGRFELDGVVWVPERTCRNVSKSEYSFRCSECDATDLDFQYPDFCHGCGAKVVSE